MLGFKRNSKGFKGSLKSSKGKSNLDLSGVKFIDIHSHILPGIDDGSDSFETSCAMIEELREQGCEAIIATPHYIFDTDSASPRAVNVELLEELRGAVTHVNLHLGNELYIDENLDELLNSGVVSSMADSKYILVELPMSGKFPDYEDTLIYLTRQYRVILAHPERYMSFQKDHSRVERLYESGVLFQCNYGTLCGQYGKSAQKTLKRLLKERKVFAFGSDIHHPKGVGYYSGALAELASLVDEKYFADLTYNNPAKLLN